MRDRRRPIILPGGQTQDPSFASFQAATHHAQLAALVDSMTDAVLSIDSEQHIVFLNPSACAMFRCRAQDVLGTPYERFLPVRFREQCREKMLQRIGEDSAARTMGQTEPLFGLREDGEEFPIEVTISQGLGASKWRTTVIVRDVTERRAAEEALRRSREDLESAVRGADIGIWRWDMRTGDMPWSPRCRELFGIPPTEEMTFERFLAVLHPEEREMAKATVDRALTHREEYNLEHRVIWPDGSLHWVAVVGRGHYDDASGEIIGMSGIAQDIGTRKEIEQHLRESEELRRLANEAANIGTYDSDLETGRKQASPELLTILGLPPGTQITRELGLQLIHPDDRERLIRTYESSMNPDGDGLIRLDFRIRKDDGQESCLIWRGRTLFRDAPTGRKPIRNIGAILDITERKRLEEALQEMNEALEQRVEERTREISRANEELIQSNLEMQQFAYVAAHDLQTPLRSISGFAQLLRQDYRGKLGNEADLWIDQVVHHVQRMHTLIKDLLAYSGMESLGRPFQPTDFNRIFDEVAHASHTAIRDSGATVTRDDLPTVLGNRIQLAQVLRNLIDNGMKYHGIEPPRIHVSARREESDWIFSVRDNGIGIARKHQDRIFEVFRRLHTQQAYPGTGIGLAICRRVVQRHGGRIWVDSEPGKGSTFYFSLPAT